MNKINNICNQSINYKLYKNGDGCVSSVVCGGCHDH